MQFNMSKSKLTKSILAITLAAVFLWQEIGWGYADTLRPQAAGERDVAPQRVSPVYPEERELVRICSGPHELDFMEEEAIYAVQNGDRATFDRLRGAAKTLYNLEILPPFSGRTEEIEGARNRLVVFPDTREVYEAADKAIGRLCYSLRWPRWQVISVISELATNTRAGIVILKVLYDKGKPAGIEVSVRDTQDNSLYNSAIVTQSIFAREGAVKYEKYTGRTGGRLRLTLMRKAAGEPADESSREALINRAGILAELLFRDVENPFLTEAILSSI